MTAGLARLSAEQFRDALVQIVRRRARGYRVYCSAHGTILEGRTVTYDQAADARAQHKRDHAAFMAGGG